MNTRLALGFVLGVSLLSACGGGEPEIEVSGAWVRPAYDQAAAFMIVRNVGPETDTLLSIRSEAANVVGLHQTTMTGDIARMTPVESLEIIGGGQAALEPLGYHVMMAELTRELGPGDTVELTLQFEKNGEKIVQASVRQD